jgi:uncharacterized protein YjbI with pentapeptide repeats
MLKNLYAEKQARLTQSELNTVIGHHERYASNAGGTRARLSMTDLAGLSFANRVLANADFTGASLAGASLLRTNLERASLYCTDLRDSDLRYANLRFADLRGAALGGANLSFAKLDNADLRVAMMMFVTPAGDSTIVNRAGRGAGKHGVDFTNCSMKKVSFGNAKLDGADFSGAMLDGANFKGAKLEGVRFDNAVLTGVNLKELAVPPAALKGSVTDVTPEAQARQGLLLARLQSHREWIESSGRVGAPGSLDGEDIRPLQGSVTSRALTAISSKNVVAIGLDFSGSQLQAASFDGADLRDADFRDCDLRGASFRNAKIAHARFERADLRPLALAGGGSRAVDLTGASGTFEQFANATLAGSVSDLGLATPAVDYI